MSIGDPQHAIIYTRVSSQKQLREGDGLRSQETRCREYARYQNFTVVGSFSDEISGKLSKRPGMDAMLKFLKQNRANPHIVIIDDISRLARGIEAHLELRLLIAEAGGILKSPKMRFGDDAASRLSENVQAVVVDHDRQMNAERTKDRMHARLQNGYWPFREPVGYRYKQTRSEGKVLVPDESVASILKEALEGYAYNRFNTMAEVARFLGSHPNYPNKNTGHLHKRIPELFDRIIYSGRIEYKPWNIGLRDGRHEGLISYATFKRIQEKRHGKAHTPARKDLNEDFPLRGFVMCDDCNEPLTAAWSKGRSKLYAYYFCRNKECCSYGKSIRKADIEGEFETLLLKLRPTEGLIKLATKIFKDLWDENTLAQKDRQKALKREIKQLEKKSDSIMDHIINASQSRLISMYETKLAEIEDQRTLLSEQFDELDEKNGTKRPELESSYRTALEFLANPWKLWDSRRFEDKRAVLKLVFSNPISYSRKNGYRTAKTTLPFKVLEDLSSMKNQMVGGNGLEPLTLSV